MTEDATDCTPSWSASGDMLTLDSDLAAMACIAPWVEALGARHGLSGKVRFAAMLCLEESISNVIRHGYGGMAGSEVRVCFAEHEDGGLVFTVEDDAPHFDPLAQAPLPKISLETGEAGGQGIRLMRGFAKSLSYESTPTGNRLRIELAAETTQAE